MTTNSQLTPSMLRTSAEYLENNIHKNDPEIETIRQILEPLRSTFLGLRARLFFEHTDIASSDVEERHVIMSLFAQEMRDMATRLEMAESDPQQR